MSPLHAQATPIERVRATAPHTDCPTTPPVFANIESVLVCGGDRLAVASRSEPVAAALLAARLPVAGVLAWKVGRPSQRRRELAEEGGVVHHSWCG